MTTKSPVGVLSRLSAEAEGVFRGRVAVAAGITRKQLTALVEAGAIERMYPDTYRMCAVARSHAQQRRAALMWAGDDAAAAGSSAGRVYELEGIVDAEPELVIPDRLRLRAPGVRVHRYSSVGPLMLRSYRGWRVTGVEATLVALAGVVDAETFEIACEDARRRRLTSVPALTRYIERFGRSGVPGIRATRQLLRELDPVHASRSTLEVKTRRLLVAHGIRDFVREFPLTWNGRTWRYDFAFPEHRTILETNGRRWHDDPRDFERDNEKWSVPAHHGYRVGFATWAKVTERPSALIFELTAARAA